MSFFNHLIHPIESFRTAPYGFAVVGSQIYPLVNEATEGSSAPSHLALSALSLAVAGGGAGLIKKQFNLRTRLETSMSEHGYDERVMATTTKEWCSRQTARIACENYGVLPDYEELCSQHKERSDLTFIPHF